MSDRPPAPPRHRGRLLTVVVISQLLSSAITWLTWAKFRGREFGDTRYYFDSLTSIADHGLVAGIREAMPEYPVPAVWVLDLPRLLSDGSVEGYRDAFVVLVALLGVAFTAILWLAGVRRGDHRAGALAAVLWCFFCAGLGSVLWLRIDLLLGVLLGTVVVVAARHPGVAGALVAAAAWLRIWPAVLALPLLAERRRWRHAAAGFALTAGAVGIVALLIAGPTRLLSPLSYQSGRGLHVESVPAIPLVIARMSDPPQWPVRYTEWKAFEIFGPGREEVLALADVASILGVAACLGLVGLTAWRMRGGRDPTPAFTLAVLIVAITCIVLVVNKTLSPQYIAWLGAPVAAAVLVADDEQRGPAVRWMALACLVAVLTQLVFPLTYSDLTMTREAENMTLPGAALLGRNLVLVWLTLDVAWYAVRRAWPKGPEKAADAGRTTAPLV
ncbi:glycosyltransferase 87 family protein [Naumannella huperziae]